MKEQKLVDILRQNKETISTMESCTAGYLATTITNIDNSSEVLKFSAITYSNEYKIKMGVDKDAIDKFSVYSFEISRQMNRIDPNNLSGNNNEIFVTIYNSKTNKYEDILITCPNKKREECKKYITNKILEKLLFIVGE